MRESWFWYVFGRASIQTSFTQDLPLPPGDPPASLGETAMSSVQEPLVASLFLVAMPEAPSSNAPALSSVLYLENMKAS